MSDPAARTLVIDDDKLAALAQDVWSSAAALQGRPRYLLGIAGIPASGKSTLASRLHEQLERLHPGGAVIVPMDGFHLTNRELDERNLRPRKGSPQTFDAVGYIALLERIVREPGPIVFPIYDRKVHDPVWRDVPGQRVEAHTRIVITEGNYLLVDVEPWSRLAEVLDACWLLETPTDRARAWMVARHHRGGRTPEDAAAHYERSDRSNTELVLQQMREPDLRLRWGSP